MKIHPPHQPLVDINDIDAMTSILDGLLSRDEKLSLGPQSTQETILGVLSLIKIDTGSLLLTKSSMTDYPIEIGHRANATLLLLVGDYRSCCIGERNSNLRTRIIRLVFFGSGDQLQSSEVISVSTIARNGPFDFLVPITRSAPLNYEPVSIELLV